MFTRTRATPTATADFTARLQTLLNAPAAPQPRLITLTPGYGLWADRDHA